MRGERLVERLLVDLGRERRRNQVLRLVGGVLGVIVEEAVVVPDLGHRERPVAEHADGQLAPRNVALDQDVGPVGPAGCGRSRRSAGSRTILTPTLEPSWLGLTT